MAMDNVLDQLVPSQKPPDWKDCSESFYNCPMYHTMIHRAFKLLCQASAWFCLFGWDPLLQSMERWAHICEQRTQHAHVDNTTLSHKIRHSLTMVPISLLISSELIRHFLFLNPMISDGQVLHFFRKSKYLTLLLLLSRFSRVRLCATPWKNEYKSNPMEWLKHRGWSSLS